MGYGIYQVKSTVCIAHSRLPEVLKALRAPPDPACSDFDRFRKCASDSCWIAVALQGAEEKPDVGLRFGCESAADYVEAFLRAVAPFVDEDSYIEMRGHEGETWRWVFKHGAAHTIWPQVTTIWPEVP